MKLHSVHSRSVLEDEPHVVPIAHRPGLWLCGVQLVLAYEWLISSLNKLFDSQFDTQLLGVLQGSTQGNRYTWYAVILKRLVIPHHTLFAFLTPIGEGALGLTLAIGAMLWLLRLSPRATPYGAGAACAALLGSAFLALNYFFQAGTPLPWINTSNAFTEGVDINIIVTLLSLVLLAAYLEFLIKSSTRRRR